MDPALRIRLWGNAFRNWALSNPEGFRLIYGDPLPGYQAPVGGAAADATRRICIGLTAIAAAAWPDAEHVYEDSTFRWSDFDAVLLDKVRPAFPELPPAAIALSLRIWARLHGLVSLEVYGHMLALATRPEKLFDDELDNFVRTVASAGRE